MIEFKHFHTRCRAIAFAFTVAFSSAMLHAQSPEGLKHAAPSEAADQAPDAPTPNATAGPTIYITDSSGQLSTVTLGTYAVHIIGKEGATLTDIGFNPKDGYLYGVSFTDFYRVDTKTGKAKYIGALGINDANALVFDGEGVGYTEGVNTAELYTIDVKTGKATSVGSTKPYKSDGDLTFYNGGLYLSGYSASKLKSSTDATLVLLNPANGKVKSDAPLDITDLFGIVCTAKDTLYGFAGKGVYQLFPTETKESDRTKLLKTLTTKGLADIYGAAYDGYFFY